MRREGNKQVPYALITRFYAQEKSDAKGNLLAPTQYLVVSKISPQGPCVVSVVNASQTPNANQKARAQADRVPGMPCLFHK